MRRSRRGKHSAMEFGGSGEDSFVAVVVTKLTGALLFILLLTMVIMALSRPRRSTPSRRAGIPPSPAAPSDREPLRITTPGTLPDAVAGRPYLIALAANGGYSTPHWSAESPLPDWLTLEESTGRIFGTPPKPTDEPLALRVSVGDGTEVVRQSIQLAILPPQAVATVGAWWKPRWHAVAWRAWMEQARFPRPVARTPAGHEPPGEP